VHSDAPDQKGRVLAEDGPFRRSQACAARLIQRFGWQGIPGALNLSAHVDAEGQR
jgi:hypothetical protein